MTQKTIFLMLGGTLLGFYNALILTKIGVKPTSPLWWALMVSLTLGVHCLAIGAEI